MSAVLDFAPTEASIRFVLDRISRDPNIAPRFVPSSIVFEFGGLDSDGNYRATFCRYGRDEAAAELRYLRKRGAYIERRGSNYYVEEKA
jgi:hypothetical protein